MSRMNQRPETMMEALRQREMTGRSSFEGVNNPAIQRDRAQRLNNQARDIHYELSSSGAGDGAERRRAAMCLLSAQRICQRVMIDPSGDDTVAQLDEAQRKVAEANGIVATLR